MLMQRVYPFYLAVLFFFVILFLYTKLAGPIPFSVNSTVTNKTTTFDVSAEGSSSIKPDQATVSVGVVSSASTVKVSQDLLNSNMNKVISEIKKLGIDEKDIKTTNYNIYPEQGTDREMPLSEPAIEPAISRGTPPPLPTAKSYRGQANLEIKVKDLNNVDKVIDTATGSGANLITGVSFGNSDQTKAENQAREEAVKKAKEEAQNAAKIGGFKLGKLINYREDFFGSVYPAALDAARSSETTRVQPGESQVSLTVTLSYEIQ